MNKTFGKEIEFDASDIEFSNNQNLTIANNGIAKIKDDGIIIEGTKIMYFKDKALIIVSQGKITKIDINLEIKSDKINYELTNRKINFLDNIKIDDKKNNLIIFSDKINYDLSNKKILGEGNNKIVDEFENNYEVSKFEYSIKDKVIKLDNAKMSDRDKNTFDLEIAYLDLNKKEILAKDISLNFKNPENLENEPRLKGRSLTSDDRFTIVKKGTFTSCKKREKCPPWEMSADEIKHDKTKKIIYYKDASLKIYDKKIFYFPKFFHPDPTVKRQSGFLIPNLKDSGNTGASLLIPYFKVLAVNKDLTFKPRLFANKNILLQNEYRQINKNSNHIMDFGLFTSELNNKNETSKSHFFSNTNINFANNFFENANFEINIEQVSNDTYLKKYKPSSELIDNENLMHNFFRLDGYNENTSLLIEVESFEDLTKSTSDRYEYIYPNIDYSKEFVTDSIPGSFNLSSNFYQKQYDTNKYTSSLVTDLMYNSETKFNEMGMLKDFQILFKNPNTINKTGSNNESDTETKLLTKLMYSLSYPLKKEGLLYDKLLKPSLSLRFSPNNTKNMSAADRVVNVNNINSFNRLSITNGVEGGQSLTAGLDYVLRNKNGNDKISMNLAQVYRDKENPDLPLNSTLNNKYSDIIGNVKFNLFDNLSFEYDFIADNNFNRLNYNLMNTSLQVNNFVTSFEYLEERGVIGTKSYIKNQTKYAFDDNNSLSFATRRNRELEMTEFYNLVYQYENDCLKAAIEYNKNFYSDTDIDPEEELLFTLTIVPFSKISSTNVNK